MTLSLITLALVAAVLVLARNRCQHIDEQGRSLLQWTWHDGRTRGWCPDCQRWTAGWATAKPQFARFAHARKATDLEVQRSRWRRIARARTAKRMRSAA